MKNQIKALFRVHGAKAISKFVITIMTYMATVKNKDAIKNTISKSPSPKNVVKAATIIKGVKTLFKSDAKQTATLVKVGRTSAANAIRASKALGLPITYMQNGILYKEHPDGRKEKIITVTDKKIVPKKTTSPLKKGMILHAKK